MEVQMAPAASVPNPISLDSSSSPPSTPPLSTSERDCNSPSALDAYSTYSSGNPQYGNLTFEGKPAHSSGKEGAREKAGSDATTANGKKPRAKKNENSTSNTSDRPIKERKARKPRDPNAPPRKRQKVADDSTTTKTRQEGQLTLVGLMGPVQTPQHESHNTNNQLATPTPAFAQIGKSEAEQKPTATQYGVIQQPLRPTSSGQRYDPIRSASAENALLRNIGSPPRAPSNSTPNARASPSIASLLDPTGPYTPSRHHNATPHLATTNTVKPLPPPASKLGPPIDLTSSDLSYQPNVSRSGSAQPTTAQTSKPSKATAPTRPLKTETPPNVASPKPPRQKEPPPPLPLGSGLLSNSAFGKSDPSQKEYAEVPNQCIVIEVKMNKETGNYVNFMREVENKYGFDVAHPRLAEHRRRMAQMAAAGAAIEAGLGLADDMPVDESEVDSNVEMGGMDEDSAAPEGTKKKRRARANEYDKHDDFIDDTEQLWEEQAMASNNGYFVWSGPLVAEPEKPADERADGTTSKRGRGRGRGGSTRGETSGRGSRGGGRGSRGGNTTRKPRITKAEKAKIASEKQEREKLAADFMRAAPYHGIEA